MSEAYVPPDFDTAVIRAPMLEDIRHAPKDVGVDPALRIGVDDAGYAAHRALPLTRRPSGAHFHVN